MSESLFYDQQNLEQSHEVVFYNSHYKYKSAHKNCSKYTVWKMCGIYKINKKVTNIRFLCGYYGLIFCLMFRKMIGQILKYIYSTLQHHRRRGQNFLDYCFKWEWPTILPKNVLICLFTKFIYILSPVFFFLFSRIEQWRSRTIQKSQLFIYLEIQWSKSS